MENLAADSSEHSVVDVADIRAESGGNNALEISDLVAVEPFPGSANPVKEPECETGFVGKLVREFESLDRVSACARLADTLAKLDTLEAAREQSYFEIGGMLSLVLKNAWFDPYPTFDKWAYARLRLGRAKAYALIHNYDVVAKAGLSAAQFDRIDWTKMRVVAPVLTHDNAEYWSECAATRSRAELKRLVKQQMAPSSPVAPKDSPATRAEYIELDTAQQQVVNAALAKAKQAPGVTSDAAALVHACASYCGIRSLRERLAEAGPDAAIVAVVDFVSALDQAPATPLLRRLMTMTQQAMAARADRIFPKRVRRKTANSVLVYPGRRGLADLMDDKSRLTAP